MTQIPDSGLQTPDNMRVTNNCRKLVDYIYTIRFPEEEKYGMQSQIRRSSLSVLLNIVEGNARNSKKEYIRFLNISNASLAETQEILLLLDRLNMIGIDMLHKIMILVEQIRKEIFRLKQYLESGVRNLESEK